MNGNYDGFGSPFDTGQATWTELMRLKHYRSRATNARQRLKQLETAGANPMDIIQERIELHAAEWYVRELESRFKLETRYF